MLLMILFINTNMGKYGQFRRKLNLFENDLKLLKEKIEYLREFCNNNNFKGETNEDTYKNIKDVLNDINGEIIKKQNQTVYPFDLNYMFYHYLIKSYRGILQDIGFKDEFFGNINYIQTILETYVKPILTTNTNMSYRSLLYRELKIIRK